MPDLFIPLTVKTLRKMLAELPDNAPVMLARPGGVYAFASCASNKRSAGLPKTRDFRTRAVMILREIKNAPRYRESAYVQHRWVRDGEPEVGDARLSTRQRAAARRAAREAARAQRARMHRFPDHMVDNPL